MVTGGLRSALSVLFCDDPPTHARNCRCSSAKLGFFRTAYRPFSPFIQPPREWRCVLALAAVTGCSSREGPVAHDKMVEARLLDVGELYRIHQLMHNTPPKLIKDFHRESAGTPSAYESIRSGAIVVLYGATLPDTNEEPTSDAWQEVLAYPKSVPLQGGPVLMLDRRIRNMTAEEFKVAKLAKSS
jgi:hypothetical protein